MIEFGDAIFEWQKVGQYLDHAPFHPQKQGVNIQKLELMMARELCMRLTGYVLTHHLNSGEVNVAFEIPASWLQHLKKRLGLRYREEIVTKQINIENWLAFPKSALAMQVGHRHERVFGAEAFVKHVVQC